MEQCWVKVVKWHDGIMRHTWDVPNRQNLEIRDIRTKKIIASLRSSKYDPKMGLPKICVGDVFYTYERWSTQEKSDLVREANLECVGVFA